MKKKYLVLIIFIGFILTSCRNTAKTNPNSLVTHNEASAVIKEMTKIMVHDISNPPLASRFFSYACLAGYEVVAQNNASFKSMHGVLKDYPLIKKPAIINYSYRIASLFAMLSVSQAMQPSGKDMDFLKINLSAYFKKNGIAENILDSSIIYGREISTAILDYAKADGYRLISLYKKYSPIEGKGNWYPTPPLYLNPVEPYFNTVRTFYLDSTAQFKPNPPIEFSDLKNSGFYSLMQEVYLENKPSNKLHKDIASFWDCNPFAVLDKGHLQFGIKKISPGAHWMGIAGIACKQANLSFDSTLLVYSLLSTTLMDAFNSCWDEKYRSNRIRPETVIRKYIDSTWQPFLQTPPFPEYPSGHSVISIASAEILSYIFGNSYSFVDTIEMEYGLPQRSFTSFRMAAEEAGISRFYGGIHYMDAIIEGQKTGKKIGEFILSKYFK